jgi:hypothetical protein
MYVLLQWDELIRRGLDLFALTRQVGTSADSMPNFQQPARPIRDQSELTRYICEFLFKVYSPGRYAFLDDILHDQPTRKEIDIFDIDSNSKSQPTTARPHVPPGHPRSPIINPVTPQLRSLP